MLQYCCIIGTNRDFAAFFKILLLYNNHKILIFIYAIIWAELYSAKIETQFVNDRIIRKTATEYI